MYLQDSLTMSKLQHVHNNTSILNNYYMITHNLYKTVIFVPMLHTTKKSQSAGLVSLNLLILLEGNSHLL